MKKFIYIALVAVFSALTFTACTEEEVQPNTELNGGGNANEDVKKG